MTKPAFAPSTKRYPSAREEKAVEILTIAWIAQILILLVLAAVVYGNEAHPTYTQQQHIILGMTSLVVFVAVIFWLISKIWWQRMIVIAATIAWLGLCIVAYIT